MKRECSDLEWAARKGLRYVPSPFVAESLLASAARYLDADIPDRRAFGPVIQALARDKLIDFHGYAPAKTSNRSPKTLWRRV